MDSDSHFGVRIRITDSRRKAVSKLKPLPRKLGISKSYQFNNNENKLMTYTSNSNNIIVTLTMKKTLQQLQNYDIHRLGRPGEKTE
jgi:hypothetical protein